MGVRGFPYGIISSLPALPWVRPAERIVLPSPSPPLSILVKYKKYTKEVASVQLIHLQVKNNKRGPLQN